MLWMIDAKGTLDDETTITVTAPRRATIEMAASASTDGVDQLVLVDEETGYAACGIRDPHAGLLYRVWGGETPHYYLPRQSPPRPWVCQEFAPGKYVIAGRIAGRQWVVERATLEPGGRLVLAVDKAPKGGGKVVCRDRDAVLHIRGDLPVPAPRRPSSDGVRIDARWEGVPPGKHAVVYPDGRRVEVNVSDGETTELPK